eukprot:2854744-Rhodomonas_salina.3
MECAGLFSNAVCSTEIAYGEWREVLRWRMENAVQKRDGVWRMECSTEIAYGVCSTEMAYRADEAPT